MESHVGENKGWFYVKLAQEKSGNAGVKTFQQQHELDHLHPEYFMVYLL